MTYLNQPSIIAQAYTYPTQFVQFDGGQVGQFPFVSLSTCNGLERKLFKATGCVGLNLRQWKRVPAE